MNMFYKAIEGTGVFEEYGQELIPGWRVAMQEFGNRRRRDIVSADAEDIAKELRGSGDWIPELCEELCRMADMESEWADADGESFEDVVYAAAEKLGVEI